MKLKDRIKTYSFWVSLTSAIILIVKLIGQKYGFAIDEIFISDLITTLCGLLVILGIIVVPKVEIKNEKDDLSLNNTEEDSCIKTNTVKDQIAQYEDEPTDNIITSYEDKIIESTPTEQESEVVCFDDNNIQENLPTDSDHDYNDYKIESNTNFLEDEIKNHVTKLLTLDKNNYSNNFSTYKKILIDEINKIDE